MSFKVKDVHWQILLDYMEKYPDFACGRLNTSASKERYKNLWINLTSTLNSAGYGEKSVEKWQKTWTDYKCNLKKRASEHRKSITETGGGPLLDKKLSEMDLRVLGILGESFYMGVGVPERGLEDINQNEQLEDITNNNSLLNFMDTEKPAPRSSTTQCGLQINEAKLHASKRTRPPDSHKENKIDHDYMAATVLQPQKKQKKIEDDVLYKETIEILKEIKDVVANGLANVATSTNNLTEAMLMNNKI